jgi:hypothetical protein
MVVSNWGSHVKRLALGTYGERGWGERIAAIGSSAHKISGGYCTVGVEGVSCIGAESALRPFRRQLPELVADGVCWWGVPSSAAAPPNWAVSNRNRWQATFLFDFSGRFRHRKRSKESYGSIRPKTEGKWIRFSLGTQRESAAGIAGLVFYHAREADRG